MHLIARRAALAAAGTLAMAGFSRKPAAEQPHDLGSLVLKTPPVAPPALSFTAADGTTHSLGEFAGRGVVLNCWATWCVPCVQEMPALAALAAALPGVTVLALSSDRAGAPAVEKFYAAHDIKGLGIWLDPHGDITRTLGLRGIPTTLLIDRKGREQGRIEGAVDWMAPQNVTRVRELTSAGQASGSGP